MRRQTLLRANGKWDAIIGWSYGTILAQEYASKYSKNVERLVLLGPQSRHMFVRPKASYDEALKKLGEEERLIRRESLNRILRFLPEFGETAENQVNDNEKDALLDELFGEGQQGILKKTEDLFGNVQFVVENYCDLQKDLQKLGLHYSRAFFQNVRSLRHLGSVPRDDQSRVAIGKALVNEIRQGPQKDTACNYRVEEQENHRNFFVMTAYDGISAKFLKEWGVSGDKKDFRRTLRQSTGTAGVIRHVTKVGIAKDVSEIKAWAPRNHKHSIPTLILKGRDDPVSAGGAAEEVYNRGLTGPRTFIEFPGVGHQFELPVAEDLKWDGIVTLDLPEISLNEIAPAIGTLVGSKVTPKFSLILEPFAGTRHRDSLILIGYGVRREDLILDMHKARENIVALFRNTGSGALDGSTDWTIKSGEFTGTVRFFLTEPLEAGKTAMVVGTIIEGRRLSETHVKVEPPVTSNGSNRHLTVPCVRILSDNTVEVWFYHDGASGTSPIPPLEARRFTVTTGSETKTIEHKVGKTLNSGQIAVENFVVKGMTLGAPDHRVELKDGTRLDTVSACVPREETIGSKLTIMLLNTNDQGNWKSQENSTWLITNDIFTAYFNVAESLDIPPNGVRQVIGTVYGVRVNPSLKLGPPEVRKDKIDWLAVNVTGENKISVLTKNLGLSSMGGPEDWTYTSQPGACNNPNNKEGLRDCLIYSFVDMDTARFQSGGISDVLLNATKKAFSKKEGFPQDALKIKHCKGPRDVPQRCTISSD